MPKKFYKEDNEAIPAILYQDSQPVGFTEITDPLELTDLYIKILSGFFSPPKRKNIKNHCVRCVNQYLNVFLKERLFK